MSPPSRTETDLRPSAMPQDRAGAPFTATDSISLAPGNANVSAARRFVTGWLTGTVGLDPAGDVCADLALVTSELVTNAVEHGGDEPIEVRVGFDGSVCALQVTSSGPGHIAPSSSWAIAGVDSVSGRGLGIVKSLVDSVYVDHRGDRTTVIVTRRSR